MIRGVFNEQQIVAQLNVIKKKYKCNFDIYRWLDYATITRLGKCDAKVKLARKNVCKYIM